MTTGAPRLRIVDSRGGRDVLIETETFRIGRRTAADLTLSEADVSKEHAEIVHDNGAYLLRDCGSKFGTRLNGEPVTGARPLAHGDRIQLGRSGTEIVFLVDAETDDGLRSTTSSSAGLGHLAAVLNGLRALGSGRVLDEVLTLVVDSALDVTSAERGFIMLGRPDGTLEPKVARARGHQTLAGTTFATSEQIRREVYSTGQSRMVADLLEGSLPNVHAGTIAAGIRHVLCVPLRVAAQSAVAGASARVIGVLYLDGRERGTLLSETTRSSLDAFATQAALAIESARLYAEATEKARLERDLRLAAEIQRALLPASEFAGPTFDLAAASLPCRTIGGDFFDYTDVASGFGFALGDVAGKGPSAALLAAAVQSNLAAQAPLAADPADAMTRLNQALLRRAVEARFATMFYGVLTPDGQFAYCNAGQEPPVVVRAAAAVEQLDTGGPVLGLLPVAMYQTGTTTLAPGDFVVVCSDGVTEARDAEGSEFGHDRMTATIVGSHGQAPSAVLGQLMRAVDDFSRGAPQADDLTLLVLRYRGEGA